MEMKQIIKQQYQSGYQTVLQIEEYHSLFSEVKEHSNNEYNDIANSLARRGILVKVNIDLNSFTFFFAF